MDPVQTVNVGLGERSYPIRVGRGLLGRADLIVPHLAQRLAEVPRRLKGRLAGLETGRHLDQLHELRRQAEMHADETFVASGAGRDFGDRERRRIGSEDRVRCADAIQLSEQPMLDCEVLEYRFDHDIAGGEGGD